MIKAVSYDPSSAERAGAGEVNRITTICIGLLLIVMGNIMPKARMNSSFGLRTVWSMKNEDVWQKSQRAGGIASVITGLVVILLAILIPGIWSMIASVGAIIIMTIVCTVISYRIYKKDLAEKEAGETGTTDEK